MRCPHTASQVGQLLHRRQVKGGVAAMSTDSSRKLGDRYPELPSRFCIRDTPSRQHTRRHIVPQVRTGARDNLFNFAHFSGIFQLISVAHVSILRPGKPQPSSRPFKAASFWTGSDTSCSAEWIFAACCFFIRLILQTAVEPPMNWSSSSKCKWLQ